MQDLFIKMCIDYVVPDEKYCIDILIHDLVYDLIDNIHLVNVVCKNPSEYLPIHIKIVEFMLLDHHIDKYVHIKPAILKSAKKKFDNLALVLLKSLDSFSSKLLEKCIKYQNIHLIKYMMSYPKFDDVIKNNLISIYQLPAFDVFKLLINERFMLIYCCDYYYKYILSDKIRCKLICELIKRNCHTKYCLSHIDYLISYNEISSSLIIIKNYHMNIHELITYAIEQGNLYLLNYLLPTLIKDKSIFETNDYVQNTSPAKIMKYLIKCDICFDIIHSVIDSAYVNLDADTLRESMMSRVYSALVIDDLERLKIVLNNYNYYVFDGISRLLYLAVGALSESMVNEILKLPMSVLSEMSCFHILRAIRLSQLNIAKMLLKKTTYVNEEECNYVLIYLCSYRYRGSKKNNEEHDDSSSSYSDDDEENSFDDEDYNNNSKYVKPDKTCIKKDTNSNESNDDTNGDYNSHESNDDTNSTDSESDYYKSSETYEDGNIKYLNAETSTSKRIISKDTVCKAIKLLLDKDFISPNDNNGLCLSNACKFKLTHVVKILLDSNKVDIVHNKENIKKLEIPKHRKSILKLLLKDKNFNPCYKNNLLMRVACIQGKYDIVKLLSSDKRIDITYNNNIFVRLAVENKHVEIFKLLLTFPKVKLPFNNGRYLSNAIKQQQVEIVRIILSDEKINPSIKKNFAITNAALVGNVEIFELLLKHPKIDMSEEITIYTPSLAIVKLLTPFKVRFSDDNFYTACVSGSKDLVEHIINKNEIVSYDRGLSQATSNNNNEIVKLLLKIKNICVTNHHVILALENDNTSLVKILLNHPSYTYSDDLFSRIVHNSCNEKTIITIIFHPKTIITNDCLSYILDSRHEKYIVCAIEKINHPSHPYIPYNILTIRRLFFCKNIKIITFFVQRISTLNNNKLARYVILNSVHDVNLTKLVLKRTVFTERTFNKLVLNEAILSRNRSIIKLLLKHRYANLSEKSTNDLITQILDINIRILFPFSEKISYNYALRLIRYNKYIISSKILQLYDENSVSDKCMFIKFSIIDCNLVYVFELLNRYECQYQDNEFINALIPVIIDVVPFGVLSFIIHRWNININDHKKVTLIILSKFSEFSNILLHNINFHKIDKCLILFLKQTLRR